MTDKTLAMPQMPDTNSWGVYEPKLMRQYVLAVHNFYQTREKAMLATIEELIKIARGD